MLKISLYALGLACAWPFGAAAQATVAELNQKMEQTCNGQCHGMNLIAQQRLDRSGWTREVEKMIRWGAVVPAEDKEALITHLSVLFNSTRPRPHTSKVVPEGRGKDLYSLACLSCHNEQVLNGVRLDRAGWMRVVDKMIHWGAYVPSSRKEELIDYLLANFAR